MALTHADRINAAIRKDGVVWHACSTCGRDWPFPKGPFGDEAPREWSCAVCANALHAKAIRASSKPCMETLLKAWRANAERLCPDVKELPRGGWTQLQYMERAAGAVVWGMVEELEALLASQVLGQPQARSVAVDPVAQIGQKGPTRV